MTVENDEQLVTVYRDAVAAVACARRP
jgi:hypothetical protein